MKKIFSIVLAIFMLISVFTVPSAALVDEQTGLEYTINYHSSLSGADTKGYGSSVVVTTGSTKIERRPGPYNFSDDIDIADPRFKAEIEKYKKWLVNWAESLEPLSTSYSDLTLCDGNRAQFKKSDEGFLRFFGLSANFKGQKSIKKNDVPFVVSGDGMGNFTVGVDNSVVGYKKATFTVPAVLSYELHEAQTQEEYHFMYTVANSKSPSSPHGYNNTYTSGTLREGLKVCSQKADPTECVDIDTYKAYQVWITGTISDEYIINVEYGNDASKAPAPSNPQTGGKTEAPSSKTTPKTDEKADTPSKNNSDIQNNNPTNEISNETSEVVLANNNEAQANKDFSANNNKTDIEKKSHTGLYIGIAATATIIAVGAGTAFVLLKKKNKK